MFRLQSGFTHSARRIGGNSITLLILFQVLTVCCVFFAVLRISPTIALVATILLAPAFIRTAWIAEMHRQQQLAFSCRNRCLCFAASIGIVLVAASCGLVAFTLISMIFGFFGLMFGVAVSDSDFYLESAVLGTIGGMIWGMAGGFLAICFATCKLWHPAIAWNPLRQSGGC